jgi:ribosomal protein S18 acetylase RimI-like enzyme
MGCVHVVFDDDREWGSLVDNLHVVHRRHRTGVGTRLLEEAARAVVANGGGGLYLWVLEQNANAQAFYQARGGRPVGRRQVLAPGGNPGRLNGIPCALRYVWPDPAVLLSRR